MQDAGFKAFVNLLNPNYNLPDRHTIFKVLIPAQYEKCLNEMKDLMSNKLKTACRWPNSRLS